MRKESGTETLLKNTVSTGTLIIVATLLVHSPGPFFKDFFKSADS